jgi:GNAT superfamily N-acetyltransferase
MSVRVTAAASAEDLAEVRALLREYAGSLGEHLLCLQDFEQEFADLPGAYAPPGGRLLLARVAGRPAGCVALRPLSVEGCEMKRLYVRPEFRGCGAGWALAAAGVDEARQAGYCRICLDTLPSMAAARGVYRALGFQPIEPYGEVRIEGALYLGLELR